MLNAVLPNTSWKLHLFPISWLIPETLPFYHDSAYFNVCMLLNPHVYIYLITWLNSCIVLVKLIDKHCDSWRQLLMMVSLYLIYSVRCLSCEGGRGWGSLIYLMPGVSVLLKRSGNCHNYISIIINVSAILQSK